MSEPQSKASPARIQLPEVVNEHTPLDALVKFQLSSLIIDCSQVKRINSVGLRALKVNLDRLEKQKVELVFEKLTPPLVEAIDFVKNLLPKSAKLESILLPYACPFCHRDFTVLAKFLELKRKNFAVENEFCPNCGKEGEFDHLPEMYFGGLTRL